MKTMKTFSVTLAILLLACSLSGYSQAAVIEIAPMWVNVTDTAASLAFSGTTAHCGTSVNGLSGTTSIVATTKLYEYKSNSWVLLASWSNSTKTRMLDVSNSYQVKKGILYKLEVSAVVTRNGITETVTASSQKTCP